MPGDRGIWTRPLDQGALSLPEPLAPPLALPLLTSIIGSAPWLCHWLYSGPALLQPPPQIFPKAFAFSLPCPASTLLLACHWPSLTLCAAAFVAVGLVHTLGSISAGCARALIHIQLTHGPTEALGWGVGWVEAQRGSEKSSLASPALFGWDEWDDHLLSFFVSTMQGLNSQP